MAKQTAASSLTITALLLRKDLKKGGGEGDEGETHRRVALRPLWQRRERQIVC